MVAGNRQGHYVLTGSVDPTANVVAPQGTRYVWINGNSTQEFLKSTGTAAGGWSQMSVGAPSFSPYVIPTDATSWATHIADKALTTAAPTRAWVCQDASGSPAPSIGSLSLTAAGAVTYQQTETGYTTAPFYFLGVPDGGASTGYHSTNAALPDPATTSQLMIVIGRVTTIPATARTLFHLASTNATIRVNTDGKLRVLLCGSDSTSAASIGTADVHVFAVKIDETANTVLFATEVQNVSATYVSPASTRRIGVAGFDNASAGFRIRAIYHWEGAAAEAFTAAKIRELMISLGAEVAW
jgi:hypothetical protein